MQLDGLHALMAILATWRLADLVALDKITLFIRTRYTWYMLRCPRCISFWAAILATVIFIWFPWANWPFALSWCYIWRVESLAERHANNLVIQENARLKASIALLNETISRRG